MIPKRKNKTNYRDSPALIRSCFELVWCLHLYFKFLCVLGFLIFNLFLFSMFWGRGASDPLKIRRPLLAGARGVADPGCRFCWLLLTPTASADPARPADLSRVDRVFLVSVSIFQITGDFFAYQNPSKIKPLKQPLNKSKIRPLSAQSSTLGLFWNPF